MLFIMYKKLQTFVNTASRTRSPDGGYPPDIREFKDGIRKLRKTSN